MTQALQLLVFVGAIAGLIRYGFYRDKKEHPPEAPPAEVQESIHFPESGEIDHDREHRGAAMSRLS